MRLLMVMLGVLAASVAAPARPPAPAGLHGLIDQALEQSWREHGLTPAPVCDDVTFLRRLSLDLKGRIPTRAEVSEFLSDGEPGRRARLLDRMLADGETPRHFGASYADILLEGKTDLYRRGLIALRDVFAAGFASGQGFDAIARDLVQATGRGADNPSTALMIAYDADKDQLAAATARVFLGVQIQCAQCHDHPLDKWTNDDFKSFAAFFQLAGVRRTEKGDAKLPVYEVFDRPPPRFPELRKRLREKAREGGASDPIIEKLKRTMGDWVEPRFLDGKTPDGSRSPRESLAAWMTARNNPWFARATVNRIWSLLLGRGLIEPVDDLGPENRALVPGLLDRLATDFAANGYDVRSLYREIVLSRPYQLAAADGVGAGEADLDPRGLFASYAVKPLGAEQVLRSISVAAGIVGLGDRTPAAGDEGEVPMADMGLRRRQAIAFRYVFMDDEGEEGEQFAGTIARALMLMNSRVIQEAIAARQGSLVGEVLSEQ